MEPEEAATVSSLKPEGTKGHKRRLNYNQDEPVSMSRKQGTHGSMSTHHVKAEIPTEAKKKHNLLCHILDGLITTDMFRMIKLFAHAYLDRKTLEKVKDMFQLLVYLEGKGVIGVGKYDKLVEIMKDAGLIIGIDEIQKTAKDIKDIMQEKLHRTVLNRCLPALLKDLDFMAISDYMTHEELFNDATMRDILDQKTTKGKIKNLILLIQQRDQDTYEKFKECLVMAKQEFLKDMLEEEEAAVATKVKEKHEGTKGQKRRLDKKEDEPASKRIMFKEQESHGSMNSGRDKAERTTGTLRKHYQLYVKLTNHIDDDQFKKIKRMAHCYLDRQVLKYVGDMDDLLSLLEKEGVIGIGMYDKLIDIMTDAGMEREVRAIHRTAIEIKDMQNYIPGEKQSETSSLDAYTVSQEGIHPSSEKLPYLKSSLTVVKSKSDTDIVEQDIMTLKPEVNILKEDRGNVFGDLKEDLKERDEFLEAIKNNDQKIEEMIRNQKIPQRSVMEVAMKQNEYFKGVQRALIEMSKLLRMEISEAVGIWCGYEPKDPHIPVFVVTLRKNRILKKEDIPESFIDYKIITRHKYVPNDEERSIVQLYGSESVRSEDVSLVNNCIATHTERLMSEHSNLSIVSPCPIKAYGYMNKKMEVKKNTCIVFYVPVKGIIPVGEKEFPKALDGIVTDVREGEFVFLGGHNAMVYHPKLRMGCCISRCICGTNGCKRSKICKIGSLGGFIDLPGDKVGCLTAAHVVLTDEEYQTYIEKSHEEKGIIHYNIAAGDVQIEMHQPQSLVGHKPFGKVLTIALEQGGEKEGDTPSVDAAIIQITDDDRIPETGSFPDGEFRDFGLTKEDPLLYTGGEILDDTEIQQMESPVIKFGCTTGLTQGKLKCSQSSVRRVDVWGKYVFPVMYKQLEVSSEPHVFAAVGDSGALVFLCLGANNRNIRPFGMVLGENSTGCTCVITPIKAVFEKLRLRSDRFKVFPAIQLSQLKEDIIAQGQAQSVQNQVLNSVLEKFESIEQQMIDTIEKKVNFMEQKINEHVDSKLSENFNSIVNSLEDNIKESSEKINSRVDTLEKNMKERLEHINSDIKASFASMTEALNQMINKC